MIDIAAFLEQEDEAALADRTTRSRQNYANPVQKNSLQLVRFADMQPRLDDGYLVKGFLGAGAMAVLYGDSSTGKTFFALHLALSVAAGLPFFHRRVRQTGVLYVAAEAGRGIENRVVCLKQQLGLADEIPFVAVMTPLDLCTNINDTDAVIAAIKALRMQMPLGLVVIDTLSRVIGSGDENAAKDMGALVHNIDRIRAEVGVAVLLVHHTGKEASRGARGHSLLRAATDTEIEVSRDKVTRISTARVTKQREYATDGTLAFELHLIKLGIDSDGDPVTSCVVEPAEGSRETGTKGEKLSSTQQRALELLADAVARGGKIPPANEHIPQRVSCVTEVTWRKFCDKGSISKSETSDAKRMAFARAAEALVATGRVGKWEEWVWIVPR